MDSYEFMQNLTTNNIKAIYIDCQTRTNLMKCKSVEDALKCAINIYFRLDDPDQRTITFINSNSAEDVLKKRISSISLLPEDSIVHCLKYQANKLSSMSYLELEYSHYYKSYDFEFFKHLFVNHNRSLDLYKFKDKEKFSYYVMKAENLDLNYEYADLAMQSIKDSIVFKSSVFSSKYKLHGEYVDIKRALNDIHDFKNSESGPFYNFLILEKYQKTICDDKIEFKLSELTNGHDAKCTARFFIYNPKTNQFEEINLSDRAVRRCEWNFYLNL